MAKKSADREKDEAKVAQIRDRFTYAFNKWEKIYNDGTLNMKFVAGDPWPQDDKDARDAAGRPYFSPDELGQYLNQAVNEVRANPRAAKFAPTGDGANDETARFYGDLMRETEYRSNAQIAYTTAYENALQRGFGFVRLRTEFEHERSHYQQVRIEPIANPACVVPDPDATRPDGSDWKYLFFIESYSREEFKREFPEAQFTNFSTEQIAEVGQAWMTEEKCQVAEYWEIELRDHELVQVRLPDGSVVSYIEGVDKTPKGAKSKNAAELQRRTTQVPYVCWYLTNGVELLTKGGVKKQTWAGKYIPFAACYGKILWLNKGSGSERWILAMTTLAREPVMAYAFAFTSQLEALGTITKNPFFAYEGTLDADQMNAIAKSLHEPVAALLSKPFLENSNQLMPLPQRNPLSVDLSSYAAFTETCRRSIQAAMGWTPLPSSAQRRNEKSGVALKQIEESGQRGSYHFIDHYNDMIRHVGVMFEDLVDKLYDTDREVITLGPDQVTKTYRVNPPAKGQMTVPEGQDVLPSTKGRHAVTVDVGPEFASERDAADRLTDSLVDSPMVQGLDPTKRDKVLALAIKAKNIGPMGDKIADIISPPENKENQPDPQQLQGMIQQAQQFIQALQQENEQLKSGIAEKQLEIASKEKIAAQADATKRETVAAQSQEAMAIATLKAQTDLKIAEMDAVIEKAKLALQSYQSMASMAQQGELKAGDRDHAREMGDRGHQQSLESQDRAAAQAAESDDGA